MYSSHSESSLSEESSHSESSISTTRGSSQSSELLSLHSLLGIVEVSLFSEREMATKMAATTRMAITTAASTTVGFSILDEY